MVIHKTYRLFVALLVLGIIAWFLVANPTKTIEKLRLAEASKSVSALIYIAEQRGYFADERLEISNKSYSSGREALKAALTGEADIATTEDNPLFLQSMVGEEISFLTVRHSSSKNTAPVAHALPTNQATIIASDAPKEVIILAGRKQVILERSEAFKRLLTALLRADHFLQEQPKVALAIVTLHLAGQSSEMVADSSQAPVRNLALNNVLLKDVKNQAPLLREQGQDDPNFTGVIDPEYLEGVSPEDVTVFN